MPAALMGAADAAATVSPTSLLYPRQPVRQFEACTSGYAGLPDGKLPPAGQRFPERLETAHPGLRTPDFSAAYAAQASEILLDAIARSNGTRPSVTRELRRTRIEGGILGELRFDQNGDLVEAPGTIFRMARTGPVTDRVITVPSASLR